MGVMMQSFYWDCPAEEGKEYKWWNYIRTKLPELGSNGFTALWLPPAHKSANLSGPSMGYDPYDYYDLGEFDQKGAVPTWFGTKQELLALIHAAHRNNMVVIADMVINHNNGADAKEVNQLTGQERWTLFTPKSGRFLRNWESFHPNRYESWDESAFGDMPDLSHHNPKVFGEILELARWMVEEIGFDGFRYDFVKGYGGATITAVQEYQYVRNGHPIIPYGVAEFWDNARAIENLVNTTNFSNTNPVDAFDFPLREMLKALCDQYGFSLRSILDWETVTRKQPQSVVTFVENHDIREEGRPIINDKLLAYSYILTHEGYPCIFWRDYFNYALGMNGTPHGIAALVRTHQDYAGGGTDILYVDDDLYIMQRAGYENIPGLIYVLNNRGLGWNGTWINTRWQNTNFVPVAWWSRTDLYRPGDQFTGPDGRGQFFAPPRGYVIYVPE